MNVGYLIWALVVAPFVLLLVLAVLAMVSFMVVGASAATYSTVHHAPEPTGVDLSDIGERMDDH